ncbi:MAG: hypothetical protein NW216_08610 [Hyphomicrobium sp.]|nr:hypothetical protein [Hyphomicrobium sp.]
MNLPRKLLPGLSLAALTIIAVLPWGLAASYRFVLPLLPVIFIHEWAIRNPSPLPAWAVFASGLAVDILTAGPLGYWSLIYLVAYVLSVEVGTLSRSEPALRWVSFAIVLVLVVAVAWSIASLYFFEAAEMSGFLWAALWAMLAYPLLAAFVVAVDPLPQRRMNDRLERGV